MQVDNIGKLDYYLQSLYNYIKSITYFEENVVLDIVTSKQLSQEEIQALETSILNFDDTVSQENHIYLPQIINPINITESSYQTLFKWMYNGTIVENRLSEVGFHTYLIEQTPDESVNNSNFTYSMKVYDSNNNVTLGEVTYSNNVNQYYELYLDTTLLPSTKSTFELQCKKNTEAGSNVHLSSLQLIYLA